MDSLKKLISVIMAFTMVAGGFAILLPYSTASDTDIDGIVDPIGIDLGYQIRAETISPEDVVASADAQDISSSKSIVSKDWAVNDTNWYYVGSYGKSAWMSFTKMVEGNHCEVWVADDLTFPSGDARNAYTDRITITLDQAEYAAQQFDEVIYPTESEYFSVPPAYNGSNALMPTYTDDSNDYYNTTDAGKVMIMIFNIKDTNFNNPSYPYYIVGFYSSSQTAYYDRNIIHIDCYDWANRTGDQGNSHSYLYESTLAHEYQHLLHDYVDTNESTWLNEGCSMYAEGLCGYGYSYTHIACFFYTPDNSLTQWADQGQNNILADYGAALLFMIYMNDHYGGSDMISAIMQNQLQSTESITDCLRDAGYSHMDFDKVFNNWRLANLLWTDEVGNGIYNYDSLTLEDIVYDGYYYYIDPLQYDADDGIVSASDYFDNHYNIDGYTIYESRLGEYGTDYIELNMNSIMDSDPSYDLYSMLFSKLYFNGEDDVDIGWQSDSFGYWWTGINLVNYFDEVGYSYDEADFLLTTEVDLTDAADMEYENCTHWLNMTTYYDIEDGWDFGFVQVSTDGGLTWESLNDTGDYCTEIVDASCMESIAANVPGLTGYSGDYINLTFNLTAYDGQEIMLGFRYMTDWGTTYWGWEIPSVSVDNVLIPTDAFTAVHDEADFLVTIVATGHDMAPMIVNIPTNDATEVAQRLMGAFTFYDEITLLVSPTQGPVDYEFGIDYRDGVFFDR